MTDDPYYTDLVQHISLPLELLGLFLAMMEIFFSRHARWWEQVIDGQASGQFIQKVATSYSFTVTMLGFNHIVTVMGMVAVVSAMFHVLIIMLVRSTAWLGMVVCLCSVLLIIILSICRNKARLVAQSVLLWIVGAEIVAAGLIGLLSLQTMKAILHGMDRIGRGHALGGIGLTLGGIGLLGEVYQVIMIDKDRDPKTVAEIWAVYATVVIALGVVAFFVHRVVKKGQADQSSKA